MTRFELIKQLRDGEMRPGQIVSLGEALLTELLAVQRKKIAPLLRKLRVPFVHIELLREKQLEREVPDIVERFITAPTHGGALRVKALD